MELKANPNLKAKTLNKVPLIKAKNSSKIHTKDLSLFYLEKY